MATPIMIRRFRQYLNEFDNKRKAALVRLNFIHMCITMQKDGLPIPIQRGNITIPSAAPPPPYRQTGTSQPTQVPQQTPAPASQPTQVPKQKPPRPSQPSQVPKQKQPRPSRPPPAARAPPAAHTPPSGFRYDKEREKYKKKMIGLLQLEFLPDQRKKVLLQELGIPMSDNINQYKFPFYTLTKEEEDFKKVKLWVDSSNKSKAANYMARRPKNTYGMVITVVDVLEEETSRES